MHLQSRYRHLTFDDRRKIYVMTGQKKSIAEIAAYLGRHQSTIYREITPDRLMIDATHLKAHRTAASLLKKGLFPAVSVARKAA